jgi:hypothetical protein
MCTGTQRLDLFFSSLYNFEFKKNFKLLNFFVLLKTYISNHSAILQFLVLQKNFQSFERFMSMAQSVFEFFWHFSVCLIVAFWLKARIPSERVWSTRINDMTISSAMKQFDLATRFTISKYTQSTC